MPFTIIRNDITKVKADAIVNSANPEPICAAGVDAAIYEAAGAGKLLAARREIGALAPGEAAVTPAFQLSARYIIHTVGPVWIDGHHGELEHLAACYENSLKLARRLGCRSIAFPLLSTGVYGFPRDKALSTALTTIREDAGELRVTLVVYDRSSYQLAAATVQEVRAYIDEHYTQAARKSSDGDGRRLQQRRRRDIARQLLAAEEAAALEMEACLAPPEAAKLSLEDVVSHLGETFQERLLRFIDERGMTDAEVYKRANIDRKVFSKIRCHADYIPKKKTIAAFAIALELNLDDAQDLMASAGYVLTDNSVADVIVSYCLTHEIYDIYEVNAYLFEFGQPLLGQV